MLLSNKRSQNSTYFQIHEEYVAMETESCLLNREFNISEGWFVYAVLLKHYEANIFYLNCANMNVGGVNYRTLGMLKFDKF